MVLRRLHVTLGVFQIAPLIAGRTLSSGVPPLVFLRLAAGITARRAPLKRDSAVFCEVRISLCDIPTRLQCLARSSRREDA